MEANADAVTLRVSPTFVRICYAKNLRCPPNVALHGSGHPGQTPRRSNTLFDSVKFAIRVRSRLRRCGCTTARKVHHRGTEAQRRFDAVEALWPQ